MNDTFITQACVIKVVVEKTVKLLAFLLKTAITISKKNNSLFTYSVEKQKQYLEKFAKPKDDIERSYFQFQCQMKLFNKWFTIALNLVSFPFLILYLVKPYNIIKQYNDDDAIFFADGKPENIIPNSLCKRVGHITVVDDKKELLKCQDYVFFFYLLRRYPFSWHFLLKCLIKIRFYRYEIERLKPKAIIVCDEYSFTSSVMTKYCEDQNIMHINVMHGEKLYSIRDSFFHFHECYIWDEFYKKLFIQLHAENTQFIIAIPESLNFIDKVNLEKTIDYTYYLGAQEGQVLQKILFSMKKLRNAGYKVAIRPHPRYSNMKEILSLASKIEIENYNEMDIETSLKRTKNAVSVYSTVLYQAYCNGVCVVIDDITNPYQFQKLQELQYIMLDKEHILLSRVLESIEDEKFIEEVVN